MLKVGEIYIVFDGPAPDCNHKNGYINLGGPVSKDEIANAFIDFGHFIRQLPNECTTACYDEGKMSAG